MVKSVGPASSLGHGTIVIGLIDGRTLRFGNDVSDLGQLSAADVPTVATEAAELLIHSMGGSCWASQGYVQTLQALWNYVPERVTG